MSGVRAVLAPVPSLTATEARVPWSDIWATGPLRPLIVAVLVKIVWWKSEFECSLTQGCEAVMFTVDPKLLAWWFLTGNTKGKFVRCFSFPFSKCPVLSAFLIFFPPSESLAIVSASYCATVSQPRTDLSAILISLFRRFSFAFKSPQRSLASLVSSLFNVDERFSTIWKIYWLNSNCILFSLCLNLKVSSILAFLFDDCYNFFSICSNHLSK